MIVPVVRELPGFAADPVDILAAIEDGPFSFLLESAVGDRRWGRYTVIGSAPREAWKYTGSRVERWDSRGGWREAGETADPIGHIGALMRGSACAESGGLPPFFGGVVGFLGYDIVRTLEKLPPAAPDDLGLPDALFLVADTVLVIDKAEQRAFIVASVDVPDAACREERDGLMEAGHQRIAAIESRLAPGSVERAATRAAPTTVLPTELDAPPGISRTTDADFMAGVVAIKQHIAAGDIFQGVLSRRIEVAGTVDPLHLYRCMRAMNPAPYLYYLKLGDFAIVGGSPEVLVRVERGVVTVRPIAGTRPRGATPDADAALGAELLADPKECAEHAMLVDLGRNDVGRVADFGTVELAESMVIERYTHVQHIVSEVRGTLAPGKDAVDALKACFPAGTVTGAPKVRAMELLAGLEPVRRGPYAGAVGYVGWGAASMDTAITIRTCVVMPDRVIVQAGAGIVADSDPRTELAETEHKARGALRAVGLARRGPPGR
jgi:anthranilate synthase component 1